MSRKDPLNKITLFTWLILIGTVLLVYVFKYLFVWTITKYIFYYLRIDSKYCQYRVLKVENVNATLAFQTWQSYNFD